MMAKALSAEEYGKRLVKDGYIPAGALALGEALVEHLGTEKGEYDLNIRIKAERNGTEVAMDVNTPHASVALELMPDGKWCVVNIVGINIILY